MLNKFAEAPIHGTVAPGFEEIEAEFRRNFREQDELGAACAIYHEGEKVVDLWGGYRDLERHFPWQEDTLVLVYSATKGLAGMTVAVAHSRGLLDYDERVSTYWPEFAQGGKESITVRQLLSHQAGLSRLDKPGMVPPFLSPLLPGWPCHQARTIGILRPDKEGLSSVPSGFFGNPPINDAPA